jgi:chromosome segregation ATPase
MKREFAELKHRQDYVKILHQLMKAMNKATDNKSAVDVNKNPELKQLFDELKAKVAEMQKEADSLKQEADKLLAEADELEAAGKTEQAEKLQDRAATLKEDAAELKEIAKVLDIDKDKSFFSKDDRERLMENIRTTCGDLNARNDLQMQTIQRLTNNRHELLQICRTLQKSVHDAAMRPAHNLAGR